MEKNRWRKLGLLVEPDPSIWWMSHYCGPTYADVGRDKIDLYTVGRDHEGISRIGVVHLDAANPQKILSITQNPILDIGNVGYFDESGVSYPWLVRTEDSLRMYFVGWQAGGRGGFQTHVGVCEYCNQSKQFKRISKAPILDRIDEEPICTGSVCVEKEGSTWRMWYTCFDKWTLTGGTRNKPHYRIRYCESVDGIHWQRPGAVAIDYEGENSHVAAKPFVLSEGGVHRMWYSHRGDKYRIGYAESADKVNWTRKDNCFEWSSKSIQADFDSEMQEYAFIFDTNKNRYMTYNGNGYGKTGVGIAILEE